MIVLTKRRAKRRGSFVLKLNHIKGETLAKLPEAFLRFVDMAGTATGRATHYNTKEEQQKATAQIHKDLFQLDRGVYTLALCLPGLDTNRLHGIGHLLGNPASDAPSILDSKYEGRAVSFVTKQVGDSAPQRVLKLFVSLKDARQNNARTRKLILRTILTSSKLELWAVKYRRKLRETLQHAWGRRVYSAIWHALASSPSKRKEREKNVLGEYVNPVVAESTDSLAIPHVWECVKFIMGGEDNLTLPLLLAYAAAKVDLSAGRSLPPDVLEGIRSTYHKGVKHAEVVKTLDQSKMTGKQKVLIQKQAEDAGVKVAFDPYAVDAVELYIYAMERGMTKEIQRALEKKAADAAETMHVKYGNAGIILDASGSMLGHATQKNRPMACALAIRDMLGACSETYTEKIVGGVASQGLVYPAGDTSLGRAVLEMLGHEVDTIFVITDGYENTPAGRFAEVVRGVRKLGITTPIQQITPVMAAEAGGVRQLSPDVSVMPVSSPKTMALGMLRAQLESDIKAGLQTVANMVLPQLGLD